MIPWTVSQQFQDSEFASLSGARIVRIAVHPDMTRAGYGSRALELLRRYYQGELADLVRLTFLLRLLLRLRSCQQEGAHVGNLGSAGITIA